MKVDNGQLTGQFSGQQSFPLENEGDGKFGFATAGIELQYSKDRKSFDITQSGQKMTFTKEK
jgi:hypothetical protein